MTIQIEFTLDTICPFTYLARRQLQLAISQVSEECHVKYIPYDLAPGISTMDKRSWYLQKYDEASLDSMINGMKRRGEEMGIQFDYGGVISNTFPVHRVIRYYQSTGKDVEPVMDALYKQYFEEQRDPASLETVMRATDGTGKDVFDSDQYSSEVHALQEESRSNVDGVPSVTFIGDRRDITISGAKDASTYVAAIQQIVKERL